MNNKNKKNTNKSGIQTLLSGITGRLFENESKSEAAVFILAVLFSAAAMVLNIITAIAEGDVISIIYSLTVGIFLFIFVMLLTVSDRFFIFKERSLILIFYSAIMIILSVTGFISVTGIDLALAILGLISALALYGTMIYDQLMMNDHPVKYWLIYCGAIYRMLVSLVMLIIDGVNASSVAGTLAGIFNGFAGISVILMLLYLFDGFSFAKYMYYEIIDAKDGDEDEAESGDIIENTAEISQGENAIDALIDKSQPVEITDNRNEEKIHDEAEYVPYTEDEESQKNAVPSQTPVEATKDDIKLISTDSTEEVTETTENTEDTEEGFKELPVETKDIENVTEEERLNAESNDFSVSDTPISISPVELKYIRFVTAHNKPDDTLVVTGMSGDVFDVWVDSDTICFINDLKEAEGGRGVRSAVIPFGDVNGFKIDKLEDGVECVVLMYSKGDETLEIRFTKESFGNFKRVMEKAGGEE